MSNTPRNRPSRCPIITERIRGPDRKGGFAFVPNRFLQDGFFVSLSESERSLYLFLVLASDRDGVSFYHFDRVCSIVEMSIETYTATRNSLIHKDLIAFDGTRFQVLSLPARPVTKPSAPLESDEDFEEHDPATIRRCIQSALNKS